MLQYFYRMMLLRAPYFHGKSSVRPFVCLSVTLRYRGHIGWNTLKLISWLISLGCSLSPTVADLLQGNHREIPVGIVIR